MNKLIEIAKANGARVNWRHLHKDGWRLNCAEVNSVNLTPDQLRATVELVCAPLVEALKSIRSEAYNDDECDFFNIADLALIDHRAIMGDKK